jgi:hypothetical protein
MNSEEIIEMAKKADLVTWLNTSQNFSSGVWWIEAHEPDDCLFKFAKLVAQHEREACIVDIQMHIPRSGRHTPEYQMAMRMIERIRARGQA